MRELKQFEKRLGVLGKAGDDAKAPINTNYLSANFLRTMFKHLRKVDGDEVVTETERDRVVAELAKTK